MSEPRQLFFIRKARRGVYYFFVPAKRGYAVVTAPTLHAATDMRRQMRNDLRSQAIVATILEVIFLPQRGCKR